MDCYYTLDEFGRLPRRVSSCAAGYDLFAPKTLILEAHSQELIDTGIRLAIPDGYYGHICSKSGLAAKSNIHVGAGIIDSDYRGNIKVLLMNNSDRAYMIFTGEAIAQIIFRKYETVEFKFLSVEDFNTNNNSERGTKGFGEMTKQYLN